ncbi:MAG: NirD/YgiW/YdeI family stress tolerance protein [Desulfovibrio sp.]|nr:NirD/YgiW/YdeI family stress tolerance protein [Desulfovibrio sp.]
MRYFLALIMAVALAIPAHAAEKSAPAGQSQSVATPAQQQAAPLKEKWQGMTNLYEVDTVAKALQATNRNPVMLVGNIVEKIDGKKNHYIFDDGTGRMTVSINSKILKSMDLTPQTKVRLMGKLKVKEGRAPVLVVRALHLVK